ncbi:MAG: bifunctional transcriptional activator/DNA repair enzyme AdaA [Candidatus Hodarchaeales archaeon]|jgi:methylphosphotriester-DNA--protein-cysteine methyltransferase
MQNLSTETMLQARLDRDVTYDGKFYVGIKTTNIFCIPSCKARQPKEENVEFFLKKSDAIHSGYRGCKRCRSETFPNVKPVWLEKIKGKIENEYENDFTEKELASYVNIDMSTLRRKFKDFYNKTPTEFQRDLKLEKAKEMLEEGENISETMSKSGFKSISGFRTAFIKKYGYSPRSGGNF